MINNKKAVTLIEITIACLILIAGILPLVTMSRRDSAKAIETEKIQVAERILESIKSEVMTMQFKTFYEREESEGLDKEAIGPFVLSDAYYPVTFIEILKIQKSHKDFKIVGSWSWAIGENNKPDKTMVRAEVTCSFTNNQNGKIERKKAFLIVKP